MLFAAAKKIENPSTLTKL